MKRARTATSILTMLLIGSASCLAQTDPKNVPQPPTAELSKFDPFLGKYEVSGDFANLPWAGTLELKKVIKGWYIEQIILIKSEGIDREFWVLATWDNKGQKYRLWGFQTLPNRPEGEIRFEADEMVTEWASIRPDGSKALNGNRYKLVSKDELEIVSYSQVENGPVEKIGFLRGRQTRNAEQMAASTFDNAGNSPQPPPEMQSLEKALAGGWSITEKFEPDEWTPNGGTGYGEEVWRRGPGGFTFMEEIHDHTPFGEGYGVGFSWWDRTKGLQGLWCINTNPQGCNLQNALSGFGPKWDGKQLVVDMEFPRNGKKLAWHEVFSDITPTSFVQTADIGEKGGPLKRWLTIHATRVQEQPMERSTSDSAEAEIRAVMAERLKASLAGDSDKVASLLDDEYLQTDISGLVQDKAAWLKEYFNPVAELIKAGKFHWEVYDQKDLQFRIHGDSAVVIGVLEAKGKGARWVPQSHTWEADPNANFSGTLRFTHVYIKQNGKWLLAALHNAVPFSPQTPK